MQGRSYSFMLQELSNNYYQHQMTFQDYRSQRRDILNSIDSNYNRMDTQQKKNGSANIATAQYSEYEGAVNLGETTPIPTDGSFGKESSD